MKELEQINDGEMTHHNMAEIASKYIEFADEGIMDPIELMMKMDYVIKTLTKAKKEITSMAMDEAGKYKDNKGSKLSVEFKLKEAGTKYDYSVWDKWQEAKDKLSEIENQMKLTWKTEAIQVDVETGEEIPKPPKKSTTSFEFKYKKE